MTTEPWATLRVELSETGDEAQTQVWALGLEGLAAFVAELDDVGGVETRDATTLGGVTQPELWVYTTPPALDSVRARVEALAATFGLQLRLTAEVRDDDDWRDEWKRFYRSQVFGEPPTQLLLRPSWIPREAGEPELEVVLDPGHAFGTGLHESTRLCLHRLCGIADTLAPTVNILDLGCGSGILAIAAARLLPNATLRAADIDPDATATTGDNAARNGLAERIAVQTGEMGDIARTSLDLLIANIRPVVLIPLAQQVGPWLAPRARVLLAGIFGDEVDRVREAWLGAGFSVIHTALDTEWSLLDLEAP